MIISPEIIRTDDENYYACPIAGLKIEDNAIFLGNLLLVKFNRAEWEKVERRYVFKDWFAEYYKVSPVFIYQPFDEINEQITINRTNIDISRLISALRLFKHGDVLDPVYTVRFLVKGFMYSREVGPFRIEYLAYPIDGFSYTLKKEEVETIDKIIAVIAKIDETPETDLIKDLINNFNLSFLPAMRHVFKLNTLFTTIEMLYGGINSKVCNHSTMYSRAFAMLTAAYGKISEQDEWSIFFTEKILELRNIVHHNKKNDFYIPLEQAIIYLREPIRLGIRLLMRLYLLKVNGKDETIFSNSGKTYKPKEVLNLSLEQLSNGDNSLMKNIFSN